MSVKRKVLAATMVVLALSASAAYAIGTDIWIGTSGNDTVNLSTDTNNTHIWGLAGSDTLTGGKTFNKIVGDGNCGTNFTVPTKVPSDSYCSLSYADTFLQVDTLNGGTGPNLIYDGGFITGTTAGPATSGAGGPYNDGNVIYGSPGLDVITATQGTSTIYPGTGLEAIVTLGKTDVGTDHIICSPGDGLTGILADHTDVVVNPRDCGLIIRFSTRAKASSASSWTSARAHQWLVTEERYLEALKTASSRAEKREALAHIRAGIKAINGIHFGKRA